MSHPEPWFEGIVTIGPQRTIQVVYFLHWLDVLQDIVLFPALRFQPIGKYQFAAVRSARPETGNYRYQVDYRVTLSPSDRNLY